MTTRSSRTLRLSLVLLLAAATPARAEPTPADIESARELYVKGLELRDKNDLGRSLERFRAAQALAPTPITTLELGRAQMLLARLLEARETLLSVERLPVRPDESHKAAQARVEAAKLADQLRARIPAVRVEFSPQPSTLPRVTIDGVLVPQEALAAPRRIDPGKHTILAEGEGARGSAEVSLREGETKDVSIAMTPSAPVTPAGAGAAGAAGGAGAAGAAGGAVEPPPPPPREQPTEKAPLGPLFYGGLAVAGVGLVVGTVTGAMALSKASTLDGECTGIHCPASAADDLSSSRTLGNVSTVSFVVGAVGAAVAVIALATRPDAPTQAARVRITSNGLRWAWP